MLRDLQRTCPGETGPDGTLIRTHAQHCDELCDRLTQFGTWTIDGQNKAAVREVHQVVTSGLGFEQLSNDPQGRRR